MQSKICQHEGCLQSILPAYKLCIVHELKAVDGKLFLPGASPYIPRKTRRKTEKRF